jgi:putative addiction module component (TIGR02574 family)
MSASLAEVERQAHTLSPDEHARLTEVLLESIQNSSLSEIEAAWQLEIENRVAAYDRGDTETFPAEDVFAEVKRNNRDTYLPDPAYKQARSTPAPTSPTSTSTPPTQTPPTHKPPRW